MSLPSRRSEEELFLRRFGWLISLLCFASGYLLAVCWWSVIALDLTLLPAAWHQWWSVKGVVLGLGVALLPVLWWLSLRLSPVGPNGGRRLGLAAWAALVVVLVVETLFRSVPAQEAFWHAIRIRAGSVNFFAREVAGLRLADQSYRQNPPSFPGLVVIGSSQMLHALDADGLASETGLRVHRRATAGMFPVEMLAWRSFFQYPDGHSVLMMLSGFDLGGRDELFVNLVRPLVTSAGLSDLRDVAEPIFIITHWREWIDLATASRFELWRVRDYIRYLFENACSKESVQNVARHDEKVLQQQHDAYRFLGRNKQMVQLAERSLIRLWERLSAQYETVIVVEGQVHPDYGTQPSFLSLSARAREIAESAAEQGLITYWPFEKQAIELPAETWADNVHVNELGREIYARLFAMVVREERASTMPGTQNETP